MLTIIERIHSDDRGAVASAELILAAPVFMFFWVIMWDIGLMQSAKLGIVAMNRTATFLEAQHRTCFVWQRPQKAISNKTTLAIPSCSREPWQGASRFWRELDAAGRENLTMDLARARQPDLVTARTSIMFRFHPSVGWSGYEIADRFFVIEPMTFTHQDEGFEIGYDRALKHRLSSGHGSLLDLFPNLFPKAR